MTDIVRCQDRYRRTVTLTKAQWLTTVRSHPELAGLERLIEQVIIAPIVIANHPSIAGAELFFRRLTIPAFAGQECFLQITVRFTQTRRVEDSQGIITTVRIVPDINRWIDKVKWWG